MIIDIAVGIVVLISAIIAFIRGFIREVLTIAGVVGGFFAAYMMGPLLKPVFRGWFGVNTPASVDGSEVFDQEPQKLFDILPLEYVADGCAYLSVFLVVVIIISILSHFLAEGLRSMGLGAIDRTLGVIFGIGRGILLVGLFYLPFHLFIENPKDNKYIADSQTAFYLDHTAEFLAQFIPESAKDDVDDIAENVKETSSDARSQLETMNILNKKVGDTGFGLPTDNTLSEPVMDESLPPQPQGEGYRENFRNNMDQLFEKQQTETRREGNQ